MTREEAISFLQGRIDLIDKSYPDIKDYRDALTIAIEALEQQPCDCISRQAVLNLIRGLTRWCVRSEDGKFNNVGLLYDDVMFGLDGLPPVTPQPKTGRWIRFKDFENGYYHIKCSECGQYWSVDGHAKIFKYCFNCGAKMEVEE